MPIITSHLSYKPEDDRQCNKCMLWKPFTEFNKNKKCVGGRLWTCRDCQRIALRKYMASPSNKNRKQKQCRNWYRNNKTKAKEINQQWASRNRTVMRAKSSVYKTRLRHLIGDAKMLQEFYEWIKSEPEIPCEYCGCTTRPENRNAEHMVPTARGGPHDVSNLCCSCISCNQAKGNLTADEFVASRALKASK